MKVVNFDAVDALDDLPAMEALAVELATLAGREIVAAFATIFMVRYKVGARDAVSLRDPVSRIDRRVEVLICERLAKYFPFHGVIGASQQSASQGTLRRWHRCAERSIRGPQRAGVLVKGLVYNGPRDVRVTNIPRVSGWAAKFRESSCRLFRFKGSTGKKIAERKCATR